MNGSIDGRQRLKEAVVHALAEFSWETITAMLRTIGTLLRISGMVGSHPAAHQMLFNGVQALAVPAAARSSELRAPLES